MVFNAIFECKVIARMAFLFMGLAIGAPMDPLETITSRDPSV